MAKIENLISEIADARLRDEIAREVSALKKQKKFGLVFEEHIPETVQLPSLPVKAGLRVVRRGGSNREVFLVDGLLPAGKACIRRENGDAAEETAKVKDLVVVKRFGEPIYPTLTPVARLTRAEGKPYHTIINAENFHALQLLLYCYAGQVDVIYIDPPYNTGARDWKYNNDYVDGKDQWRHSKWLSMMKKRLVLAKRLLKNTGLLLVAIDDHELHHLRALLDQIMGPENFITSICIEVNPAGQNIRENSPAISHDYCLIYSRNIEEAEIVPRLLTDAELQVFPEEDEIGPFLWDNLRRRGGNSTPKDRPGQWFPLYFHPETKQISLRRFGGSKEIWPIDPKGIKRIWRVNPAGFEREYSAGTVSVIEKAERLEIVKKSYLPMGRKPKTLWKESIHSATSYGTKLLINIIGANLFTYPKSLYLIRDCLKYWAKPESIILDFFAGSGTTFHATALLNATDGGNRRCILVTNNEVNEKLAKQLNGNGLLPGDRGFEKRGICESVTWPRCKYVTRGRRDDGTSLPGAYLDGRELKEGFEENLEYFRLDFLDPHEVAYGEKFEAILPILWLMGGAKGERESVRGYGKWFIPKKSPYAVLIKEEAFPEFKKALLERPDIGLVFLVTDSEEAYREMSADLPGDLQTKMLYKSYLDNFRINTVKNL